MLFGPHSILFLFLNKINNKQQEEMWIDCRAQKDLISGSCEPEKWWTAFTNCSYFSSMSSFFFYATFQKVLFLSSYRTLKQVKDLVHIIRRERERERQETSIIECYLQSLQDVYKPFEVRNGIGINISDGLSWRYKSPVLCVYALQSFQP